MEEDGGRWRKMEEDGGRWKKNKVRKKVEKKGQFFFCLESAGDGLGTVIGVQKAPKNIIATRLRLFRTKKNVI